MKRLRSGFFLVVSALAVLCVFNAKAVTLNASVDRVAVEDGDVVKLSLEIDGQNKERPDTAPLQKDFEVLGTSNMTQMNIVNGRASTTTQWVLNLRPRRVGILTIPPIELAGARSQPIEIRVVQSRRTQGANPDLFLETEIEQQSSYVQAQIHYTLRLFHAIPLQSGQLSGPRSDALLIHRVGEDRNYVVTRDGRRYRVVERQYALFAQQSGKLTLEAPVFEGQVIDTRRGRRFGNGLLNDLLGGTRAVRAVGERREISVLPRPAATAGQDWVPAHSVELVGQWEPEATAMKVGEPVTLTLKITAHGLTGAQLPEMVPTELDGFSVYPDRAEVDTVFTAEGNALGTRVQKIAFIPRRAGNVAITDIVLHWWNTKTDSEEVARLPGKTWNVEADSVPARSIPHVPSESKPSSIPPSSAAESDRLQAGGGWMWLSVLLVLAWLVTIAMWMRERRGVDGSPRKNTEVPAAGNKNARRQILQACTRNDATATRRALLAWGAIQWPESPPLGLEQIAARVDDQELRQALLALDRALYAEARPWDSEGLRSLLQKLPTAKPTVAAADPSALPTLYAQSHAR